MKRLIILFTAVAASLSFYSCEPLCKTENTGDVIVTNNSSRTLWYDATDSEGNTNENRSIQAGASSTYKVPAGTAKVWAASENVTTAFFQVGEIDLAQCATENFSYTEATIAITNSTGYIIEIAVEDDFTTTGVFTLSNNYIRTFYNMPADRTIYLGIRIPGIANEWVWEEEYLEANETFQWTWTYSKYLTAKSANIQRADPGTVVTRSKR
jgi:hypothetical protein